MKVSIKGFIYHKEAEGFEDCFDRYAVNTSNHKFSVSDGVSKSFFPGVWADLIVRYFVNMPGKVDMIDANLLRMIQKKWSEIVTDIVNRPNQKYYVRNFYVQGRSAAATFVGLHFLEDQGRLTWEAYALGDSFLFFVPQDNHSDNLLSSDFIYLSSKRSFEFDNFPDHFDSLNLSKKGKIKQIRHDLKPGTFLLMTDALSEWFLKEKDTAWKEIMRWQDQFVFERRISKLRKHEMQNDDAAILIINVVDDGIPGISYDQVRLSDLEALVGSKADKEKLPDLGNQINDIADKFELRREVKKESKQPRENLVNPLFPTNSHTDAPDINIEKVKEESNKNENKVNFPLTQADSSSRSHSKIDSLNVRTQKERRKRSFIRRKFEALLKFLSIGNVEDDEDTLENQPPLKPKSEQGIDAITDKF